VGQRERERIRPEEAQSGESTATAALAATTMAATSVTTAAVVVARDTVTQRSMSGGGICQQLNKINVKRSTTVTVEPQQRKSKSVIVVIKEVK
jgi:hypothetical protein